MAKSKWQKYVSGGEFEMTFHAAHCTTNLGTDQLLHMLRALEEGRNPSGAQQQYYRSHIQLLKS